MKTTWRQYKNRVFFKLKQQAVKMKTICYQYNKKNYQNVNKRVQN